MDSVLASSLVKKFSRAQERVAVCAHLVVGRCPLSRTHRWFLLCTLALYLRAMVVTCS